MMDKAKVIDKIQKLLALSTSSNLHEASLAAEKAGEMLAKYDLDMMDVESKDGNKENPIEIVELDRLHSGKYVWEGRLAKTLANVWECDVIRLQTRESKTGYKYQFFGMRHDMEILIHFFRFLRMRIGKDCEKYQSKKERYSFALGMIITISERLQAMMVHKKKAMDDSNCTDLVIYKDQLVKGAVKEKHPTGLVKRSSNVKKSAAAFNQGIANGNKVALNRPIENNGSPTEQIR